MWLPTQRLSLNLPRGKRPLPPAVLTSGLGEPCLCLHLALLSPLCLGPLILEKAMWGPSLLKDHIRGLRSCH